MAFRTAALRLIRMIGADISWCPEVVPCRAVAGRFSNVSHMLVILAALIPAGLESKGQVVINELFFDPVDRTKREEFLEIHNAGRESVDLGGWSLADGVRFTIPAGTTVQSGGFLVVSANPDQFQRRFGFRPLGPWSGELKRDGERVMLAGADGRTRDSVDYRVGFPWPTAVRGAGPSMELVHPELDRQNPASWRSSRSQPGPPPMIFIPENSPEWLFRKGTNEASVPVQAWRATGFVTDRSWIRARTSVGYGDDDDQTPLADMRDAYTSIFLRHSFVVSRGTIPQTLILRVRVDDGCIVWLNGREAARLHFPEGEPVYNSTGLDHEAGAQFEEVLLDNASAWIREGTNVVAVQAFNATIGSSDFTADISLASPGALTAQGSPTPGKTNSVFNPAAIPMATGVEHFPAQPRSGETVRVVVRTTNPQQISEVNLSYSLVRPGNYIRLKDGAYSQGWTNLVMNDQGLGGDLVAGDGQFTALIPGTTQLHRHLVRYRVMLRSSDGTEVNLPYEDDESPNFAWFTYDGIPSWRGAIRPGAAGVDGEIKTFGTNLLASLPAYHLLAVETDVINSQYNGSFNGVRQWGTLVWNGQVYDHIQFHNRGEASTYVSGKNKWRIHFNRARRFAAQDAWGRPRPEPWDVLNLNACASPWAAVHRGMAGLDEAISFRVYQLLGMASPDTHPVQFRIIDSAVEASATDQYSGDLWGLYLAVEQPDGPFLDVRGKPDGSIYKLEGSPDKKHQGTTQPADISDWNLFSSRSGSTQPLSWWRTNMNLEAFYNFHVGNRVVGNIDLREGWNHYFYNSPDGLWEVIPWDLDMQFFPKTHWSGTIAQKACLNVPQIRQEMRNRAREVLDLLLSDRSENGGQIGQLIDEFADRLYVEGSPMGWPELDQCLWNDNPRTAGDGSASGQTNHRRNFFRTPFSDNRIGGSWTRRLDSPNFKGSLNYLLDYCTDTFTNGTWTVNNGQQRGYGYRYVAMEAADAEIPLRPEITYAGEKDFPVNGLRFSISAFADPQGSQTFGSVRWRLAEIAAPGKPGYVNGTPRSYEITEIWSSGELTGQSAFHRIPAAALKAGHTYRVRARYGDNSGRTSHWSNPVEFVAGPAQLGNLGEALRITEIHYKPGPPTPEELREGFEAADFEFVEVSNLGTAEIELSDIRIRGGIEFNFTQGTRLAPGQFLTVAGNVAAFVRRNPNVSAPLGTFGGNLENQGDLLQLILGQESIITEVSYSPARPWPVLPEGSNHSLVWNGTFGSSQGDVSLWSLSRNPGGSPGSLEGLTYAAWANSSPGALDANADGDGDGHPNWVEFALGGNPMVQDPPFAIGGQKSGPAPTRLVIQFNRRANIVGVTFVPEVSGDLKTWIPGGRRLVETRIPGTDLVQERHEFETGATAGPMFVRVRLTRNP